MIKELLLLYTEYCVEVQDIDLQMGGYHMIAPNFEGFMAWLALREAQIQAQKSTDPMGTEEDVLSNDIPF